MTFAALLALTLQAPPDTGEQFYKFPVGSTWRFSLGRAGGKSTVELKVLKEEGGKVHLESRETREGEDKPEIETLLWWVEDGFLIMGELKEGQARPVMRLYKVGSKKGDTWKSPMGEGAPALDATHMGTVPLAVKAGKYPEAVHVRFSMSMKIEDQEIAVTFDVYLVPKVGMAKMVTTSAGEEETLELQEFKPGP